VSPAPRRAVRWLKFNAVGAIGIAVQLLVLSILRSGLHLDYLVATPLAVEAAVIHNFLWHEHFTWAGGRRSGRLARFAKFNFTTGALSILGNLLLMRLLVGTLQLSYLPANILTVAFFSVVNFLVSDCFVFRASLSKQRQC
jgi:putative flippase GtrA